MNELESWLDIVGYEGYYQVSNLGRVRSLDRGIYVNDERYSKPRWVRRKGKILGNGVNGTGRRMVILCILGTRKNITVHRLVARHFLPNPNNLPVVNHINHDHVDNRASNLEWCTYSYNTQHAIAAGRMDHMYRQHKKLRKISKGQAIRAKGLLALGWGNSKVAKEIGISYNTVYHISAGHTWKHI